MSATLPRFQSDGAFTNKGLINLTLSLLLASIALGFAANWVSQFFYLIVLFPLGMGFVLLLVGNWMVHQYKIRNRQICTVTGLLGALLMFVSMHYFEFRNFSKEMHANPNWENVEPLAEMTLEEVNADSAPEDRVTAEEFEDLKRVVAASNSFMGYLHFAAHIGVEIGRSSSEINLGYVGTWIYWLLEMGLTAAFVAFTLRSEADKPFCTHTESWMDQSNVIAQVQGDPNAILGILESGSLEAAPSILSQGESSKVTQIELHQSTDPDSPNQVIEVSELVPGKKEPQANSIGLLLASKEHVAALTESLMKSQEGTEAPAPA